MKRTHILAVLAGLVLYLLVQGIQPTLRTAIMGLSLDQYYNMRLWTVPLDILTRAILILLPGFIAGLLASTRGIAVGFVAGTLGALLTPLILGGKAGQSPSILSYQWYIALSLALGAGLFSAAAGAAGQLVRPDKSQERTRGEQGVRLD